MDRTCRTIQRTFKPKKSAPFGSKGLQLKRYIDTTLGQGDLGEAVRLPIGENLNEWLAVHTVDFFNSVNILYSTLMEVCTPATCPTMSAGPKQIILSVRLSYKEVSHCKLSDRENEISIGMSTGGLMESRSRCPLRCLHQTQLDDGAIFPQHFGAPFPPNFRDIVKTILKRLFRVYAHIYHSNLEEVKHLNTYFKHFTFFTQEFQLIDRVELAPLNELIETIMHGR
uniref:Uncharacterized protein n=1 Tax=Setaria viridis TaxID=4556 RepID=A0A4U6T201_SETVI|nr:hypothetical protein SEVIR_9G374300v2 [Setaria viridis]